MAVDMFIKLEGIKGEAKDGSHLEEIDVLAWSWGASNSGTLHAGGGGGGGKVNVQDLSFTKWVDKSSVNLLDCCNKGKHIPKALLTVRKAGDPPLEYVKVALKDVLVTSVSTGGSGGEDRLTENVTLNFAKINFEYVEQDVKGKGKPSVFAKWDVPANKEWDGK